MSQQFTRWEYAHLNSESDELIIYRADGNHQVFKIKNFPATVAQLGLEGWEMVNAFEISDSHINRFCSECFFKRPIR
jgi:hypothetical protein